MKKRDLEKVGKKWVEEGIITEEQLTEILKRETTSNPNYIIILFAALLTVLGFFTFMMSDWAQQPGLSRVLLMIAFTMVFYLIGARLYQKRGDLFGISFIVIGYAVFGAGLLLVLDMYNVVILSAWPIIIWTLVGLLLYYIYPHPLIYGSTAAVIVFGHIYYASSLAEFSWVLSIVSLIGLGLITFRSKNILYSYVFSITFIVHMIILTTQISEQYYWFIVFILPFYLAADLLKKEIYRLPIKEMSILSMFIFNLMQTFMLDSEWYIKDIQFQWSFIIIWLILIAISLTLKIIKGRKVETIDFLLFLPIIFIPGAYLLGFILLFLFSLGVIFTGFRNQDQRAITIGTTAFLITTFMTYIQLAWDTINRSLFFFIGGLLLFVIGYVMDKQMKQLRKIQQEEEEK